MLRVLAWQRLAGELADRTTAASGSCDVPHIKMRKDYRGWKDIGGAGAGMMEKLRTGTESEAKNSPLATSRKGGIRGEGNVNANLARQSA